MSLSRTTEAEVRRELLRIALHNAGRSVWAQAIVVGFIVWLGWRAGGRTEAYPGPAGGGGLARRYAAPARLDEAGARRASRELEGNAAMAGAFWVASVVGIYAHQSGSEATAFMVMACGSTAVAAYFMSLVGHSFL